MQILTEHFKKFLLDNGAELVGIGDLSQVNPDVRRNMPYGICVAVAIPPMVIEGIKKAPTPEYYDEYNKLNERLDSLVTYGAQYLQKQGYEAYPQTTTVVAEKETEYNSILPHKTIATRAGIGWIGKCALLVTKEYGSAVRISVILTNAPLKADAPINESKCGNCMTCTKACPAGAVKGTNWSISTAREDIFDPVKCRRKAREIAKEALRREITLCGKCIYVCPFTQTYIKNVID